MLARVAAIAMGLTLTSTLDAAAHNRSASRTAGSRESASRSDAACVRFWAQARYTVGYDHLVYLENDCDEAASCVVWTNVNPEAQPVVVGALSSAFVLTFRGSPQSSFTAFVRCLSRSADAAPPSSPHVRSSSSRSRERRTSSHVSSRP